MAAGKVGANTEATARIVDLYIDLYMPYGAYYFTDRDSRPEGYPRP